MSDLPSADFTAAAPPPPRGLAKVAQRRNHAKLYQKEIDLGSITVSAGEVLDLGELGDDHHLTIDLGGI